MKCVGENVGESNSSDSQMQLLHLKQMFSIVFASQVRTEQYPQVEFWTLSVLQLRVNFYLFILDVQGFEPTLVYAFLKESECSISAVVHTQIFTQTHHVCCAESVVHDVMEIVMSEIFWSCSCPELANEPRQHPLCPQQK